MPRRVFFSFHYQEDIFRVNQVRNAFAVLPPDMAPNKPVDKASWEKIQRRGEAAVTKWIDEQLDGCGVTAVLIGSKTATRPFVQYEIKRSIELGKGLLGIRIHNCKCPNNGTSRAGSNPLELFNVRVEQQGFWSNSIVEKPASQVYKTYDWKDDAGIWNFTNWVDEAARIAGR